MTLVSLTFDDGLDCHLDRAIPLLERHGLRGTFYLPVGSDAFARRYPEWRSAAQAGHELGNHTIFHPGVARKPWVTEGIAMEGYSLDRMALELKAANTMLTILDGQTERTFAFPCSNPWIGHQGWAHRGLRALGLDRTRLAGWVDRYGLDIGAARTDYTPAVVPLFVAARCGGLPPEALPRVPPDRHRIRGVEGDGLTLTQLEAALDSAIARNAWLVLVFHGIGGGHRLSCDESAFAGLCARLATDNRLEVLPLLDAAKRIWPCNQ